MTDGDRDGEATGKSVVGGGSLKVEGRCKKRCEGDEQHAHCTPGPVNGAAAVSVTTATTTPICCCLVLGFVPVPQERRISRLLVVVVALLRLLRLLKGLDYPLHTTWIGCSYSFVICC